MILITGASGLVGSHLLLKLLGDNKPVRALIRNESGKAKIARTFSCYQKDVEEWMRKIDWVYGDVTDKATLDAAFLGVGEVYHCAAFVSFDQSDQETMMAVNVEGTRNVVELCLKQQIRKLVHVSSIAAIGKAPNDKQVDESCGWPSGNISAYALSKTESEKLVWEGTEQGLCAVIVNPSVILGPGDLNSGSGKIVQQAARGMLFYTRGTTGFVDVRDVADVMVQLMNSESQSERFIVNAYNKSYLELFSALSSAMGVRPPRIYARRWLTELAWRVAWLMHKLGGPAPVLTRASARTAHSVQGYSSEKLIQAIDFSYRSFELTIQHIASNYTIFSRT